ncbi:conserved hypothetical protein [Talaromyces stipitatus ATCC 10500]|uniref:Mediator of RNA polymerase II transcription subunit 4 n=1 Tax=Talaromyces stipitatus (strain ATCC 10500 / CBS 375.48 / QM 6759 / NRRL 1006) TaxID=441959 RepID=B8M046_TALSN|nr:uncharacterized protein TSTA_083750 [Talaromyces stipitatus ATCC 10500]EED21143.1 conserved hypothetical protein [Talaromyces stipitatus ATCC 10500]
MKDLKELKHWIDKTHLDFQVELEMNAQLSSALDGLENKLNSLLTSLTTPAAVGAPAAATALLESDDVISSALDTLRMHQANYAKVLHLRSEAYNLEERIQTIVRDISGAGKEIAQATGDDDDDDYEIDTENDDDDDESETDRESENTESITQQQKKSKKGRRKEVDYKLLLEFARRISKYNAQAAADATTGVMGTNGSTTKKLQRKQSEDAKMIDANGLDATIDRQQQNGEQEVTVGTVTKEATSWLEESADADRQSFMIPYPNEDRIRMGLMGQLQLAAVDGNIDPEKEAERLVQEAEGISGGVASGLGDAQARPEALAEEAGKAAMNAGARDATRPSARGAPPPAQPRPALNLDLYDPEDDD